MGAAVVRVVVDAEGRLSPAEYATGVRRLQDAGHHVVATAVEHLPERDREIEFIVPESDVARAGEELVPPCTVAFGTPALLGVITYISRGTDGDALSVLRRFGVSGEIVRTVEGGADVVTAVLPRRELARVSESRLHTAMEAALNVEVRIVAADE